MSKFMNLFNAFVEGSKATKAVKAAKLVQRNLIDQRINAAAENGTLFDSLRKASFLVESGGELGYRFKPDSLFDRFGQGVSFPAGADVRREFCKLFMKSLTGFAAIVVAQTFKQMKDGGVDTPQFDVQDPDDKKLALSVLASYYEFGTAVKFPSVVKVEANRFKAATALADTLFASIMADSTTATAEEPAAEAVA